MQRTLPLTIVSFKQQLILPVWISINANGRKLQKRQVACPDDKNVLCTWRFSLRLAMHRPARENCSAKFAQERSFVNKKFVTRSKMYTIKNCPAGDVFNSYAE